MSTLLKYAIIAFVISLIAGALGFSGVSEKASGIAKLLFFIFLVIAIVIFIAIATGVKLLT